LALNDLYDRGYSREELVPIAAEGEAVVSGAAHADNVAPALLGGFTIATENGVRSIETNVPLVACLPEEPISTREAREVVPTHLTIEELVTTVGNAATLSVGMCRSDPELVGAGMADEVVTPNRAALITGYEDAVEAAVAAADIDTEEPFVLYQTGAHGVEAITYVLGPDAPTVARAVVETLLR
ncbi:thiamine-phosphate synthase family protein, partial [Halolamina salina]|uniref:GHMP family kinase ATP-binding protein n=1 Tax=Halolamina salina TaxID=1220023 RepID=UPI00360B7658